jgi:NAD(P)-dependent dehydrogenase (short-subunit alcohol dehydrogenase family)
MTANLQLRTVMVSGASRGIGGAIARRLHAEGHRLSLGLRNPAAFAADPAMEALSRSDRVLLHPYDAGRSETAEAWVASTAERFGEVGAVVPCAGVFSRVAVRFAPEEEAEIQRTLQVNLMGPWWLCRAAWSHLEASGDGRILMLVSKSGLRVKGRLAAYSASKFALMALCEAMRNEGWEAGIRVTALCPGWVNTAMAAQVKAIPPEAMTQPEDLAATAAHLLTLPPAAVPFEYAVSCLLET